MDLKQIISQVVIAVIAIAIFAFIEKIQKLLVRLFSRLSTRYSNGLYINAAKKDVNKSSFISFVFLSLFLTGLFIYIFMEILLAIIPDSAFESTWTETDELVFIIIAYAYMALMIIGIVFFLVIISRITFIRDLVIDFLQKMAIIRPALTDTEINQVEQKWALMKSRKDYDKIKEDINKHLEAIDEYEPDKKAK